MNGMYEREKYDFYLKIFEKLVNEVYGSGSVSDANVLLAIIGELVINIVPQLYLKHRRLSFEDFCQQLDSYLNKIKEETIKEYRKLLIEEKF